MSDKQVLRKEYDVVVAGGGIAGIAAALAAAREGSKVVLLEKEYALGGLATLGLIVIYLPLCDGDGVQMSAGISEELLKLSVHDSNVTLPKAWEDENASIEERRKERYQVTYNAPTLMINAEKRLVEEGVTVLYDARMTDVTVGKDAVTSVTVATKRGPMEIIAKAFVDCTGDADLCYFADEETVDDDHNRRTGWYFANGKSGIQLVGLTDPLWNDPLHPETDVPPVEGSRYYSGTDIFDISAHMIDMRKFIMDNIRKRRTVDEKAYPLIIPSYHGFRMTRRLADEFEFSEGYHEGIWFEDAIGMIGNWKYPGKRYSIPYRTICGNKNKNLYVAGRNTPADKGGWDLLRVIPSCAVTGEAAGVAAAMQAKSGARPEIGALQQKLREKGVLLLPELFAKREK